MKISMKSGSVVIDGREFTGKSISITGDKVFVDGVQQSGSLVGDVFITVNGDVESIDNTSGTVEIKGSAGNVKTVSGSVKCNDVTGNIQTVSGSVSANKILGQVNTISGNITK